MKKVLTVQKMMTHGDFEHGLDSYWLYYTPEGGWSAQIEDAKTWSRSQIRHADAVAAKFLGAVVSAHEV